MGDGESRLKIDIAIPAYNEETCIADILDDVTSATCTDWFCIDKIFVISDACTDNTDKIVFEFHKKDQRVRLITKPKRQGKNHSINRAISITDSDALVLLDADVRLAHERVVEYLVRPIYESQAALVGANVVPVQSGSRINPARAARYFDCILENERRRRKPISYWSVYGRALAMSRKLYRTLRLPDDQADDLFIYYTSRRAKQPCAFSWQALVYFEGPKTIHDFIEQYSRFAYYVEKACQQFGVNEVNCDLHLDGMLRFAIVSLLRYPYEGFMWGACCLGSKTAYKLGYNALRLRKGLYKTQSKRVFISTEFSLNNDRVNSRGCSKWGEFWPSKKSHSCWGFTERYSTPKDTKSSAPSKANRL